MTDNRILRTEDWDRRRPLCKLYGYCAAIVYEGTAENGARVVACTHRIRVKEWAAKRSGSACRLEPKRSPNHTAQLTATDSEWYQGYNKQGEYVIAFRDRKLRDWALLL